MLKHPSKVAFTLIELLVVVAIIALLISILLPSMSRAKEQARMVVCLSNMKQIGMAFMLYAEDFNGHLPGGDHDAIFDRSQPHGHQTWSWLGTHPEVTYFMANGKRRRGWGGIDPDQCPDRGTLFPYAGRNREVYACPSDRNRLEQVTSGTRTYIKPNYSYTAPKILTGVQLSRLEQTWYPKKFKGDWLSGNWTDDSFYLHRTRPWIGIEEDDITMSKNDSAGWSSDDGVSDRHFGKGGVIFADGGAEHLEFQRDPNQIEARRVFTELGDGRLLSAGSGAAVQMNDIFTKKSLYPTEIVGKP